MGKLEKPRSPQDQISRAAVLVESGALPVEIIDLSSGGFRLRAIAPLIASQDLQLRFARYGNFPAGVHWVERDEAGGRFLEPIRL